MSSPKCENICENEDGAKVAPIMVAGGSHSQVILSPEFEEHGVSSRHMTRRKRAWWIRIDDGIQHKQRPRKAQSLASSAEQARDEGRVEETQGPAQEAEGRNGEGKRERDRPDNAMQALCTS